MSKEIETEGGEKETVYTTEEYSAKETELATVQDELKEARRLSAERGENLKSYSQMSESEKAAFDANTTILLKREETLVGQINDLNTKLTDKEKKDNDSTKTSVFTNIHHGDEATKTKLEEKYALLSGMPETNPQEIAARAKEAAVLAGIQLDQRNPLFSTISGEAPTFKPKEEFVETPKGTAAAEAVRKAMGLETPKQ